MKNKEAYTTPQEMFEAYREFCQDQDDCENCPAYEGKINGCEFRWLDLECDHYDEKDVCPFCGYRMERTETPGEFKCPGCEYTYKDEDLQRMAYQIADEEQCPICGGSYELKVPEDGPEVMLWCPDCNKGCALEYIKEEPK